MRSEGPVVRGTPGGRLPCWVLWYGDVLEESVKLGLRWGDGYTGLLAACSYEGGGTSSSSVGRMAGMLDWEYRAGR